MTTAVKAVFFDVDETLVDFDAAAVRAHTTLFGDTDGYLAWCQLTPQYWVRYTGGELDFRAMREARMAHYLEMSGLPSDGASAREMEARRWELVESGFETYPDVADCLATLRDDGYLLGVITNNDSAHQRRKLALVGLADAFDTVVISGEVGFAKPDAAIFNHACETLGVAAEQAMHVGDLIDVDARAAAKAGLHGVWLDRYDRREELLEADATDISVVTGLGELPSLLG